MITITHVLKDGTEVPDITGMVVSAEEHEDLYNVIISIGRSEND